MKKQIKILSLVLLTAVILLILSSCVLSRTDTYTNESGEIRDNETSTQKADENMETQTVTIINTSKFDIAVADDELIKEETDLEKEIENLEKHGFKWCIAEIEVENYDFFTDYTIVGNKDVLTRTGHAVMNVKIRQVIEDRECGISENDSVSFYSRMSLIEKETGAHAQLFQEMCESHGITYDTVKDAPRRTMTANLSSLITDAEEWKVLLHTNEVLAEEGTPYYALIAKADNGEGGSAFSLVLISDTENAGLPEAPGFSRVTPYYRSRSSELFERVKSVSAQTHPADTDDTGSSENIPETEAEPLCEPLKGNYSASVYASDAGLAKNKKLAGALEQKESLIRTLVDDESAEREIEFTYNEKTVTLHYEMTLKSEFFDQTLRFYDYDDENGNIDTTVAFYTDGTLYEVCGSGFLGTFDPEIFTDVNALKSLLEEKFSEKCDFSVYDDFEINDLHKYNSDEIGRRSFIWKQKDICGAKTLGEIEIAVTPDGKITMFRDSSRLIAEFENSAQYDQKTLEKTVEEEIRKIAEDCGLVMRRYGSWDGYVGFNAEYFAIYKNSPCFCYNVTACLYDPETGSIFDCPLEVLIQPDISASTVIEEPVYLG